MLEYSLSPVGSDCISRSIGLERDGGACGAAASRHSGLELRRVSRRNDALEADCATIVAVMEREGIFQERQYKWSCKEAA